MITNFLAKHKIPEITENSRVTAATVVRSQLPNLKSNNTQSNDLLHQNIIPLVTIKYCSYNLKHCYYLIQKNINFTTELQDPQF